ncbi:YDG/SRA domain-containing protein [Hymenobacter ruricola]|uniref:HNH endonuclease n=1 Tax=Hymenobacter ruricola TaxID=2791023 RepID=A0ABS0HYU1_9BACT|nr:YDG/SRA domain-containing protein [Hymenobacter ruricola]MBF9219865.1 HNH endonuclease [Hymenobacter ruricola]
MPTSAHPVFGSIPGILPGHEFASRLELWGAGVHRQTQAGISARQGGGAESIVLSGGYEDDEDFGSIIIYTGRGGRSAETNQQVADQALTGANLELVRNEQQGLPLRVTRKVTVGHSSFYRYAGLYRVVSHWAEPGKSGHRVWRFRLELLAEKADTDETAEVPAAKAAPESGVQGKLFGGLEAEDSIAAEPPAGYGPAPRRETTTLRIVRDTAVTRRVKMLHEHRCQVCGTQLRGSAGPYAEAAHIRPLGAPHHGPDVLENVLCLCPNHHVLFDLGSFGVADDGQLLGVEGKLRLHKKHVIDPAFLAYQRIHFYEPNADETHRK